MRKNKYTMARVSQNGDKERYMLMPSGVHGVTRNEATIASQYGSDTSFLGGGGRCRLFAHHRGWQGL